MAAWLLSLLLMDAMYEPGSRVHGARPHRDNLLRPSRPRSCTRSRPMADEAQPMMMSETPRCGDWFWYYLGVNLGANCCVACCFVRKQRVNERR